MKNPWKLGFALGFIVLGTVLYSAPGTDRDPAQIAVQEGGDSDELFKP